MKMTLKKAMEHFNGLNVVGNGAYPISLSYAVSYNLEVLSEELKKYEQARIKLCEQYANKNEDGTPMKMTENVNGVTQSVYDISDENRKLLEKEMEELLETEVDLNIRTVKMEVLSRCEENERYDIPSVAAVNQLMFMLVDTE